MKLNHVMLISLVILAALTVAFAPLQVEPPLTDAPGPSAPISDTSPEALAFVAYVIAITAFFQKRLGLEGYALMGAGALVGAVIWFAPLVADAIPAVKAWIDSGIVFVKLLLTAFGSVDFVTNIGARIATAKMTGGEIVVGSVTPSEDKK